LLSILAGLLFGFLCCFDCWRVHNVQFGHHVLYVSNDFFEVSEFLIGVFAYIKMVRSQFSRDSVCSFGGDEKDCPCNPARVESMRLSRMNG